MAKGSAKTGWGVMRDAPWHLAGVFETIGEAEARATKLGAAYKIRYGEQPAGSDKFIWTGPGKS